MEIGQIINNRYQVICLLGKGGFGEVWEVNDLQNRENKVLKILQQNKLQLYTEKEQNKIISLFQQEAKILQKLTHPGIPKGYDYFTISSSETFTSLHCLVMEKVAGENLKDWLETNQKITDVKLAINWLKQLTEILTLLHKENFIHRDIKPENIILKSDGTLVLIDFGSVRQMTNTYLIKTGKNEAGTKIFSFSYTPPEQFSGLCFPQSDFFALGRTFVHLLTGNNGEEFDKNQVKDEFQSLAKLIDYMIEEYPGKRPQNTSIILEYLSAIENNNQVIVKQTLEQLKNQYHWHYFFVITYQKILLNKTLIAAIFVFLTLILSLLSPQISTEMNNRGLQSFEKQDYKNALWQYRIALFFNNKSVAAHYNLGSLYESQKQIDLAKDEYKKAIDLGKFADAYNNLARLEILTGNYQKAISLIETAFQTTSDPQTKHYLYKNLGWAKLKLGEILEAKKSLQEAINLNSKQAAPYCLMAQVLEKEGRSPQTQWQNCLKLSALDDPEIKEWRSLARHKIKQ
jgi:serine/threonine protein kinase